MGQWLGQVMPLDSLFNGDQYFYSKATWQLKFAWLPHRCDRSNKLIWLYFGMKGKAMYGTLTDSVIEYHWMTVEEHLLWCIRNEQ